MTNRIEPGFYKGRVVAGSEQFGHTSNGNEQIALDIDVPDLGRRLTTFLFFSDAAAPYSLDRLKACGWSGDNILDLTGVDKNEIIVQVRYETYNNKEQMKVEIMTGGGRVTIDPMSDKDKRAFGARMAQVIKSTGGKPAAAPSGGNNNRTAPSSGGTGQRADDDIPF